MNRPRIPLLVPDLPRHAELAPFLAAIDEERWYTNFGPLVRRFENEIPANFGEPAPYVVTTANGTLALEIALSALKLPQGARVLIPALTFVATASAIVRTGFVPVFAEIDSRAWVLTPEIACDVLRRERFDCVVPVAAFGCPLPAVEWDGFSLETGIPVLIDAAGAFGNQKVGDHIALAFSLHATKAFGVGEGGLVVSRDAALIDRVRRLSNFGIDTSTGLAPDIGSNAKMSEVHAAVGLAALKRWPERSRLRRQLHGLYCAELSRQCPAISLQARPENGVYTILQVALPGGVNRDRLAAALATQGIETRAWYLPLVPDHPAYAALATGELTVTRALGSRLIGLPFHLDLSAQAIAYICSELAKALA